MGECFIVRRGGGGTGCTLTITAPVGATVTISKDGKSKPSKVATTGTVVFKGLETGTWTITITDGTETASKTVEIKADYQAEITFFSATLQITYPAGLTCTATDGVTTLTAPDTSGTWACVVPNAGTWTVALGNGLREAVTIAATGERHTVNKWYIIRSGVPADIGFSTQIISGRTVPTTQGDGYINYKEANGDATGVLTDNAIDVTSVNTIVANINIVTVGTSSNTKFNGTSLVLTPGKVYSNYSAAVADITHYNLSRTKGRNNLSIDATSITGNWYVGFAIGGKGNFNVYDLWLEV